MSWVKLDDGMLQNTKIAAVGALGFAVHVAGIVYCGQALTDGFVPYGVAATLLNFDSVGVFNGYQGKDASTIEIIRSGVPNYQSLEDAELWAWDDERRGWWLHDYLVYNPSREESEQAAAARSEQAKRAARARWDAEPHAPHDAGSNAPGNAASNAGSNAKPMPKHAPVPVPDRVNSSVKQSHAGPVENPTSTDDETRQLERNVLERIADQRLKLAKGVKNPTRYRSKILAQLPGELDLDKLRRLIEAHPGAPIDALAGAILGEPNSLYMHRAETAHA